MPKGSPSLDTVRVGGPISSCDRLRPGWSWSAESTEAGVSERSRRRRLPSGAVLDVRGGHAYLEASIPKLLNGRNFPAVSVDDVVSALPGLYREAESVLAWSVEVEGLAVNRLDVVSDLDAGSSARASLVLSSLAAVPSMGAQSQAHHHDPSLNRAQTITKRTRTAGSGTLYDKGGESRLPEAAGVLRFEARERQATLRRSGIATVTDLRELAVVDGLGRSRFGWCGFDVPMVEAEAYWAAILALPGLAERSRWALWGYADLLRRFGSVRSTASRMTDYRWRRLVRSIGVLSDEPMRLDYDEGLVMAA